MAIHISNSMWFKYPYISCNYHIVFISNILRRITQFHIIVLHITASALIGVKLSLIQYIVLMSFLGVLLRHKGDDFVHFGFVYSTHSLKLCQHAHFEKAYLRILKCLLQLKNLLLLIFHCLFPYITI